MDTRWNFPRRERIKFTPRARLRLIQRVTEEPRPTSKTLQTSISGKVRVHDLTIKEQLGGNDMGQFWGQNYSEAKRKQRPVLHFPKKITWFNFSQILLTMILWFKPSVGCTFNVYSFYTHTHICIIYSYKIIPQLLWFSNLHFFFSHLLIAQIKTQ